MRFAVPAEARFFGGFSRSVVTLSSPAYAKRHNVKPRRERRLSSPRWQELSLSPSQQRTGRARATWASRRGSDEPGAAQRDHRCRTACASGTTTVVEGDRVRTGVTAIVPHGGNLFQDKVAGAVFVGNAFGKLAGIDAGHTSSARSKRRSSSPTRSASARRWMRSSATRSAQPGNEQVRSVNALVGETNDGGLNDIRGLHVTREHVLEAIRDAKGGAVAEGAVGAGTGTICYGWKGGIGTSSRKSPTTGSGPADYTVGVLAQTNFGGNLTIARRADLQDAAAAEPPRSGRRHRSRRPARTAPTAPACSSSPPTRRSTRAISAGSPPARCSASPAPDRPTATAAATSRSPSRRRPRCAAGSTTPRRARADPADRRDVAAVRGGARSDRRGGLQLAVPGDDRCVRERHRRGDSDRTRPRAAEERIARSDCWPLHGRIDAGTASSQSETVDSASSRVR